VNGLIKAREVAQSVRAFAPSRPAPTPIPVVRSATERALDLAHGEIAVLRDEVMELRETAARDCAKAYESGKCDGRTAADDDMKQRIDRLDAALLSAQAAWERRLGEIDVLAVQLARTALAKLFADSSDFGDLVSRAIKRKLSTLQASSVVAIVVSEGDFNREALATLLDGSAVAIATDPALATGACRVDLKLGHIDLGTETLASELDAALAGLIGGESRS
jgi:type III secretion protein L